MRYCTKQDVNLSKLAGLLLNIVFIFPTPFGNYNNIANAFDEPLATTIAPNRIVQTKSGLQYSEISEGTGETPRFGDLISFYYTLYYRENPSSPLIELDNTFSKGKLPFLHKHGNGRVIRYYFSIQFNH